MRLCLMILLTFFYLAAFGQQNNILDSISSIQQSLENMGESIADMEDDYLIQQLEMYRKHPVDLNSATGEELSELLLLNPLQIESLITYRKLLGYFIDFYELQAVPYWDTEIIRKLKPFVNTSVPINFKKIFRERLKSGEYSLMMRTTRMLEKSEGYFIDQGSTGNRYPGSPQRIAVRFKYAYKNLLQYGIVAEKDPGEDFFQKSRPKGFDFYSAHVMIKNIGCLKTLVVGDYSVVMGQGLIQAQGLAFRKGADLFSVKRQAPLLRPYNSFGESNFQRGVGVMMAIKKTEVGFFVSSRRLDANLVKDSLNDGLDFVSSIQTSGLHRTRNELEDKSVLTKLTIGGNLKYGFKKGHLGFNMIHHIFNMPLMKDNKPYNLFQFAGNRLINCSVDYGVTFRNFHFFGESALSDNLSSAMLAGIFMSVSKNADVSLIYRNISRSFHSLNSAAFTEGSSVNNENGLFTGVSLRPYYGWQLDAYCDVFRFPWLRYRVDGQSYGSDCMFQLTYKPSRSIEIYSRLKHEKKGVGVDSTNGYISMVHPFFRKSFRLNLNYKINKSFIFRSRIEMVQQQRFEKLSEEGFLLSADLLYKPLMKPISSNARILFFETGSYDTRLYAYESDVLYTYSIPVIYGKGVRYYINLNIDLGKNLSFWLRWAQTIYSNKTEVGSGLDATDGNIRSDYKMQVVCRF